MKLSNIKNSGRYRNLITGKEYNVKNGYRKERGTDLKFYLYRGSRVYLSDREFYQEHEKISN